jgi:hypothetical protein
MPFCSKCGGEIDPDSTFCGSCGTPVDAAPQPTEPAQAPPVIPAPQTAYVPPTAAPPSTPYPQPAPKGGGGKIAILSLLGLLIIGAIVVLLLGFAVGPKWFVGDDSGDGGTTTEKPGTENSAVEKVVDNFFKAMETKDGDLLIGTLNIASMEELADATEADMEYFKQVFEETVFSMYKSMKFDGLKYDSEITGNTAAVEVVAGTLTMVDDNGDKTSGDVRDSGQTVDFDLVKEGGKWYIDVESLQSM